MQNQQQRSDASSNVFGGFSMKLDYQDEKKKNTPSFTVQIENGFLINEYQLNSKVDLFVKLKIENQHFKTPIVVDCGHNPVWGKEAIYSFYENQLKEKQYIMQFELWNYETELGDIQLGIGELNLIDSFNNNVKQAKIPLYDVQNEIKQQQIGYLITNVRFSYNFIGNPSSSNSQSMLNFGSPLKFKQHVPIQGLAISKQDIQERTLSFEERMKNLKEKYNIPDKQQQQSSSSQSQLQSQSNEFNYKDIEIPQDVYNAVHQGLVLIGKNRPSNPLRELGYFLYNYQQPQQQ